MTGTAPQPSEAMLHAYVDGVLPVEQVPAVEGYLAEHPAEARRIEAYRRQNSALRALGDYLAAQPVPARPARRLRGLQGWRHVRTLAAAVLLLAAGAGGGWWLRGELPAPAMPGSPALGAFALDAAMAHRVYVPEVLHPVEVGAAQEKHLVTWLSKRLGNPVRAPYLKGLGFELVGGRLLPSATGPAAQFMYQDAQGVRLTLYVLTADQPAGSSAFRFVQKGDVGVFYWLDGALDYALAGELQRERLLDVAMTIYKDLRNM
ncbi:MAG TPA: anti-sigma factor [bacterium]